MSPDRGPGLPGMDRTVTIALPTSDRRTAYDFYRALGFETPGDELADDGVPEPLRVGLGAGVEVMLIPTVGFGWVTAGRATADRDTTECIVTLPVPDPAAVEAFAERVRAAGGEIVAGPEPKSWGHRCTFADPDGHLWQVLAPPS